MGCFEGEVLGSGDTVGECVGWIYSVGAPVIGVADGEVLGTLLGLAVGNADGFSEGGFVIGASLGSVVVGYADGFCEGGLVIGATLGFAVVGFPEGSTEGAPDGGPDGIVDGELLGLFVGVSDGFSDTSVSDGLALDSLGSDVGFAVLPHGNQVNSSTHSRPFFSQTIHSEKS